MTTKKNEDNPRAVAKSYIDTALKLQGNRRPSDEVYERAVAHAEQAFRGLSEVRQGRRSIIHSN